MLKLILSVSLCLSSSIAEAVPSNSGKFSLAPIDERLLLFLGVLPGIRTTPYFINRCKGDELPIWEPETCHLKAYLDLYARPINASDILGDDAQVIYFGETHLSQGSKRVLKDLLPALKLRGFSVLAMEMFNASQQTVLDDFFSDRVELAELENELRSEWGYKSSGYIELIAAAKNIGIRVLALDYRDQAPKQNLVDNIRYRDTLMAKRIADEIKADPTVKIFALTGSLHAQSRVSMNGEMLSQSEILHQMSGATIRCITIQEKKRTGNPITEIEFSDGKTKPSYLPLDRTNAYCDGLVLLPTNY
jgi:hypothetical protein